MAHAAVETKKSETNISNSKKAENKATAALYEMERCPRCGEPMVETYCKSICTNCGYMRDCNDQW